jgi:alkanesulfonate monooxygenase SsuD/methylene tetrahydromethanopterin reductase-like flavin-dependent oxidoreductase (luciferase family)
MLRRGRPIEVPPPEKALRFLAQEGDAQTGRRTIVGTPDMVRDGLESLAREYGAQEAIVVTITYDHEARKRSYQLIAEAFAQPRAAAA